MNNYCNYFIMNHAIGTKVFTFYKTQETLKKLILAQQQEDFLDYEY